MMWGKILFCGGWPRCRSREAADLGAAPTKGQPPLRARRHDRHLKPRLCRMGRRLRASRRRHRDARQPSSSRVVIHLGRELPAAPACRSDPRKPPRRTARRCHTAASRRPPAETPIGAACRRLIAPRPLGKSTPPKLEKITSPFTASCTGRSPAVDDIECGKQCGRTVPGCNRGSSSQPGPSSSVGPAGCGRAPEFATFRPAWRSGAMCPSAR